MPQAPKWLSDMFSEGDGQAWDVLEKTLMLLPSGLITPKIKGYIPTQEENYAILYLIHEWDYTYDGKQ